MKRTLIYFTLCLIAVGNLLLAAQISRALPSSARMKARYYYLQGAEATADNRFDEAYTYFKKAYETDTTYNEAAFSYGVHRLITDYGDTTESSNGEWEKSIRLLKRLIDEYPADFSLIRIYSQYMLDDPLRKFNGLPSAREAVRVLERVDSLGTSDSFHLMLLSHAYSALGMPDSIIGALRRFERREGSSAQILGGKVSLLYQSNAPDKAREEIEKYRRENPRDSYPLVLLSMLFNTTEQADSAKYYMEQAESLDPDNIEIKGRLAFLHLEEGDTLTFSRYLLDAINSPQGDYADKIGMLRSYLDVNRPEAGTASEKEIHHAFTVLHSQFPQDAQLFLLQGAVESNLGYPEKGTELIQRAVDLNPEDQTAHSVLVQSYIKSENKEKALEEIDRMWESAGPSQDVRSVAVWLATEKKEYGRAIRYLEDCLREVSSELSLADTLSVTMPVLQEMTYENIMTLSEIFQEAGDVYHKAGDRKGMARSFENALVLFPGNPMTLNNYAYFLALGGESLDRALELIKKAIETGGENPMYTDTEAWIHFKRGDMESALREIEKTIGIYDKTIENNPDEAEDLSREMSESLLHYAEILRALGREEDARVQITRLLKIEPDNEDAKEFLRKNR